MNKFYYHHLNVFATEPFCGAPVTVCLNAADLPEAMLEKIATELHLPHTAFVLPPGDSRADFRVRVFTPEMELAFSGAGITGIFFALAQARQHGLDQEGNHFFYVETGLGIFQVAVVIDPKRMPFVRIALPRFIFTETEDVNPQLLIRYFKVSQLASDFPLVRCENYLLVSLPTLQALDNLDPDYRALRNLSRTIGVDTFILYTLSHVDTVASLQMRVFRPALGILEEVVTPIAHGMLGVFLYECGVWQPQQEEIAFIGEQGDRRDRPCRVLTKISLEKDEITAVEVGGTAVQVGSGWLEF
ncbi:MAG: PhzF family phenazine biosynthesis protein [Gemmatimonadetes bacterium]|nr:MAG: PhzF family phenazine biosynthesis protein [Gemmatimonadota bacterium]